MLLTAFAALVAVCAAGLPVATAGASVDPCRLGPQVNHLVADATQTGVISLRFYNAEGARVAFYECVGDKATRLGSNRVDPDPATNPPTTLDDATTWSCDRLVRRFAAVATLPGGSLASGAYSVRTVSCAHRFELRAARRAAPGSRVRVRVRDRWGIGAVRPRLCIAAPGSKAACRRLAFGHAVTIASRSFRATQAGDWRAALRLGDRRAAHTVVRVGEGPAERRVVAPTVLATGDSTIQGVDSFLADELGDRAEVHSDGQPGSGVTRNDFWRRHAVSQTRRLHQRITVISVGAATDSLPLPAPSGPPVACCGEAWVVAYSQRVATMMHTYLRGGRGRVFWLTPPLPRYGPRAEIVQAVSDAVMRAAGGLSGVTVVRVDQLFSPHGYQDVFRYRGRDVRVRELDGIHLNISGTAILAKLLAPAISAALTG